MFYEQVEESVQYIRKHVKTEPLIGIILGSGLGSLVEMMEDKSTLTLCLFLDFCKKIF